MEFQQHPERYRGMEASTDDRGDASPKLPKTPVRKASSKYYNLRPRRDHWCALIGTPPIQLLMTRKATQWMTLRLVLPISQVCPPHTHTIVIDSDISAVHSFTHTHSLTHTPSQLTHSPTYHPPTHSLTHSHTLSPAVRIRSRLKKLMARRPQLETLKKSGIIEGVCFFLPELLLES